MRRLSALESEPCSDGGGGTTGADALVIPVRLALGRPNCSSLGKAGAGATISLCPILMSLALRGLVTSTVGGGAITAACSRGISRFVIIDSTCGGGATTGTGKI